MAMEISKDMKDKAEQINEVVQSTHKYMDKIVLEADSQSIKDQRIFEHGTEEEKRELSQRISKNMRKNADYLMNCPVMKGVSNDY